MYTPFQIGVNIRNVYDSNKTHDNNQVQYAGRICMCILSIFLVLVFLCCSNISRLTFYGKVCYIHTAHIQGTFPVGVLYAHDETQSLHGLRLRLNVLIIIWGFTEYKTTVDTGNAVHV